MTTSTNTELGYRQAVELALRILAGDWGVAVLAALATRSRRTTELVAEVNTVEEQVGRAIHDVPLTVSGVAPTLKRLTAADLLLRTQDPTPHPRVWYRLTPAGRSLLSALTPLAEWAQDYHRDHRAVVPVASTQPMLGYRQAVELALRVLDGDWVVAVLAALAAGPLRTTRLVAAINAVDELLGQRSHDVPVTRRGLAPTLKRMTTADLLLRSHDPTIGPAVWYRLTPTGRALLSALTPLAEWAQAYRRDHPGAGRDAPPASDQDATG